MPESIRVCHRCWVLGADSGTYVSFSCIRRNANSVAHSLARYANGLDEDVVWLEDSPPPALDALSFDLSSLNE